MGVRVTISKNHALLKEYLQFQKNVCEQRGMRIFCLQKGHNGLTQEQKKCLGLQQPLRRPKAFYLGQTQTVLRVSLPWIECMVVDEPLHQPLSEGVNWVSYYMQWDIHSVDSYGFQ